MIVRFCLSTIMLLFVISNARASKIVETYCNNQVKHGEWMLGAKDKKIISDISKEFDAEHKRIVTFLDKLPVKSSEKAILTGMAVKPLTETRITEEHLRFQWEIPGKKSNLSIIIHQYKGCVSLISLMNNGNMNFYNRSNILSNQP